MRNEKGQFIKNHKFNVGRICSKKTRNKISIGNKGKKLSEEHKQKTRKGWHKNCIICNNPFWTKPSHAYRRKYCSVACMKKGLMGRSVWNKNNRQKRIKIGLYIRIYKPNHPYNVKGYIREHRFIMEQYLGRYLNPAEVIHHINGIQDDNRIENLMLFSGNGKHLKWHKLHPNPFS